MSDTIERELDIPGLRAGLLRFTRAAYRRLPKMEKPRILDIGCGSGSATLELCRLGDGEVVGIDIDDDALEKLRSRVEQEGLKDRVTIHRSSLVGVELPDECFDLLWEEGVLHLLELPRALAECRRLLKPGGFLVSCETMEWFDGKQEQFHEAGFTLVERLPWPRRTWWTDYYAPLEQRIGRIRQEYGASTDLDPLTRHEGEIRMVKPNPERFDCGHSLLQKSY